MRFEMVRDDASDLAGHVVSADRVDVEAIEEGCRRRDACLFVIDRSDASVDKRRRQRLSKIVAHRSEHDRHLLRAVESGDSLMSLVDDEQRVHPDVALWVPLGFLRTTDERLE